ncbi:hypothetical protein GCM10008098_29520 [Rhodanobacter panaciterrae]|uniref:Type 1 fimbrial protein n=1 Tax=Rhodanobacter panaciterrae TaxID=490572 RepID=A0ABQ3A3X2_9GAMM|nr:hypothetical protein [Rhodanobacter panaciterrae]GGY34440.1 hypothetical protein GCM10008098_29520 [Rhodanobacter panaciterrae]
MSVAVVGMLCIPQVSAASESTGAASGRITFTGTIVEATCSATTERIATWVAGAPELGQPHLDSCAKSGEAAITSQVYTTTAIHISNAETDPVLSYFNDYVRAAEADPILITQVYE